MSKKNENWFEDVNPDSVEKGKAILPNIDLPNVGDEPREFKILGEPYNIETPNSAFNPFMTKVKVEFEGMEGEIILPKSLKHSIAVSLSQLGKDYTTAKLTGMTILVSQTKGSDGYNYYNCLMKE